MAREDLLTQTFVELADVWVDDGDLTHVGQLIAQRCVQLFNASAAGILLADSNGHLRVSASTNAQMHDTQLHELRAREGPCLDCYRTGQPVVAPDLALTHRCWPRFAPVALAAGFRSTHAVPVRVRDHVIGALNLFRADVGNLSDADMLAAQALAQATASTILRQRPRQNIPVDASQRRPALEDQLTIEQAKGALAGRTRISIDEANSRLRRYADHHELELTDVCQQVLAGTLSLLTLAETRMLRRRNQGS